MSAQLKALTIQNGTTRRILDASSLEVGLGVNSAAGQDLTVKAADFGAGTGVGQLLHIIGGFGGATSGNGGFVDIGGGTATSGRGGGVYLHGGDSATGAGGAASLYGGNGTTNGGDVNVNVGTGAATGNILIGSSGAACPIYLGYSTAGSIVDVQDFAANAAPDALFHVGAFAMSFNGLQNHEINVAAPTPAATAGKTLTVKAGPSTTTGTGGTLYLHGGAAPGTGAIGNTGGDVEIQGGLASGSIGAGGGSVRVLGADATGNRPPGNVNVTGGNAVAKNGGGYVHITAGDTATYHQNGGAINLHAGSCTATTTSDVGIGGPINIVAGNSGANNGGSIAITAGNGVAPFGANGGSVFIDAGNRAGEIYVCGDVLIGSNTTTQNVYVNSLTTTYLQQAGSNAVEIKANSYFDSGSYPYLAEVESGAVLRCANGGLIDLPPNFGINAGGIGNTTGYTAYANPGVGAGFGQVTATNLNTLTAGPASDASTLHYHSSAPGALVEYLATTTETVKVGTPVVAVTGVSGVNTVQNADANGGSTREGCVGLAVAAGAPAAAQNIAIAGILPVPYGAGQSFDAASTALLVVAGATAYVSETVGLLTVVAPNAGPSSVQKVGMIISVDGTNANLLLQIGDLTLLPA